MEFLQLRIHSRNNCCKRNGPVFQRRLGNYNESRSGDFDLDTGRNVLSLCPDRLCVDRPGLPLDGNGLRGTGGIQYIGEKGDVSGGRDEKISDKDATDNKICADPIHKYNLHPLDQISNSLIGWQSSAKGSFGLAQIPTVVGIRNSAAIRFAHGPNWDYT
jgi:hypothetical protein